MKLPSLFAAVVISTLAPASAITDAEITPAALAGKSLTFTIDTAGGGFADTGTWSGTFGNPTFTVTKLTGNTVNITTTHTTTLSGFTIVTLPQYLAGSGTTTITLFTSAGVGRYEMNFSPVDAAYQIGTFTIGAAVVKGPEIEIRQQPQGRELVDGKSTADFGAVLVGKIGTAKVFKVKNTGTSALKNFVITTDGKNKSDFIVGPFAPGPVSIPPGGWVKLKVNFKPKDFGTRKAVLHIKSNDKNEASFDIKLTGDGVGIK